MPPELEERAEVADRVVCLVVYATLLGSVVLMLSVSSFSAYAVGLTANNWMSTMALGALVSYVPLSLAAIFKRLFPSGKLIVEPESRGSFATWYGLAVFGSLSIELWRALCITALTRLDLSAWIAVVVVAAAFGAAQLSTSIARATGAAAFGGVAGFLFVKTGSLVAPVTLSLVTSAAHIYRARHASSQVPLMSQNALWSTVLCPVCNANFQPGKVKRSLRSFTCPACGQELVYETRGLDYFLFGLSFYGVPVLLYFLRLRGSTLLFASIGGALLTFFVTKTVYSLLSPPKAEQREGLGGLRLTNKSPRDSQKP